MTMIKLNLKGGFKKVQEGIRDLEITDVKVTPSGAPEKMILTMKDVEDGASLQNTYNFKSETSVWAMGMMLSVALGLEDGAEFDTKDAQQLVGKVLKCEVAHSEYNGNTYANVKKILEKVEKETTSASKEEDFKKIDEVLYGRSEINNEDDLD